MRPDEVAEFARQLRDRARVFVQDADLRAKQAQENLDRAERFLMNVTSPPKPARRYAAPAGPRVA